MSKESPTKEFKLPEPLPLGYPFRMFAEYVIDRVPEFQSVSGARKGAILIDAVVAAETSEDNMVRWPTDLWKSVTAFLKSEGFHMPKHYFIQANGAPTDQLVPLRLYLPLADAILEADDPPAKSETVAADVAAPQEQASKSEAAA